METSLPDTEVAALLNMHVRIIGRHDDGVDPSARKRQIHMHGSDADAWYFRQGLPLAHLSTQPEPFCH